MLELLGWNANIARQRHVLESFRFIIGIIKAMKPGIHPEYHKVTATCVCGNAVDIGSTKEHIRVEICGNCHPYYTGTQKIIDTEGRVDRFVKRYKLNKGNAAPAEAEKSTNAE